MMMGFGFLGIFLFWGVLLTLLFGGGTVVLRQRAGTRSPGGERQPTARQILDERLALGEITEEEYEAIRAQLKG